MVVVLHYPVAESMSKLICDEIVTETLAKYSFLPPYIRIIFNNALSITAAKYFPLSTSQFLEFY